MMVKDMSFGRRVRKAEAKVPAVEGASLNPLQAPLSQEIQREYSRLITLINPLQANARALKEINGTGGKVSVADLIAYQIGWGKRVIHWYESGISGEKVLMPGEGFLVWDYTKIAQHFYKKYQYDSLLKQEQEFDQTVLQIINIVEKEYQTGNLDKIGVWSWCTLPSGKPWPLSKWIKVNTASPYKRAHALVKQWHHNKTDSNFR